MSFRVLHLIYTVLLLLSTAYEVTEALINITAGEHPTKDDRISISPSSKNASADQCTVSEIRKDDGHIVCNIYFNRIEKIFDVWSNNKSASDYSTGIFLLDSTKYANSLEDFVSKYPTVTVVTQGKAVSESTFGDVGKNKFGAKTYATRLFTAEKGDVHYEVLVKAHKVEFDEYEVSVNIGLGFKTTDTLLYLAPYIDGYIYSTGPHLRGLDFGLLVSEITFNPK